MPCRDSPLLPNEMTDIRYTGSCACGERPATVLTLCCDLKFFLTNCFELQVKCSLWPKENQFHSNIVIAMAVGNITAHPL